MTRVSDFRFVKLNEVNLLEEVDKEDVIECRCIGRRRTRVVVATRRIYSARIFGRQDPMTVVVYNDSKFGQASHPLNL
jgi:hypothetical protein